MLIPIRCFSCGKIVGHLWEKYQQRIKKGENPEKVLNSLGLDKHCCRALFLGNVDLLKEVAKFQL